MSEKGFIGTYPGKEIIVTSRPARRCRIKFINKILNKIFGCKWIDYQKPGEFIFIGDRVYMTQKDFDVLMKEYLIKEEFNESN